MNKGILTTPVNLLQEHQFFSVATVRILGYGLVALAIVDFISILIPLKLMNPMWELQTIGVIIERIPLSLLGIVFVFYGTRDGRKTIELKLLKILSWLCLVFAIFLMITFPLNIVNGFRIYYGENAKTNLHVANKVENISKFETDLKSANTLDDISNILAKQSRQKVKLSPDINKNELKSNILENLAKNQEKLKSNVKQIQSQQKLSILKNTVKWNLGALISAFIFFFIWKETSWARREYEEE